MTGKDGSIPSDKLFHLIILASPWKQKARERGIYILISVASISPYAVEKEFLNFHQLSHTICPTIAQLKQLGISAVTWVRFVGHKIGYMRLLMKILPKLRPHGRISMLGSNPLLCH